jgi:hypothetical protein
VPGVCMWVFLIFVYLLNRSKGALSFRNIR